VDVDELIYQFCEKQFIDAKDGITWLRREDVERLIRFLQADQKHPENGDSSG
jgi:hypothetical protein